MERKYLKSFGSRIRTKLNSIKRPPDIAAKELGCPFGLNMGS